MPRHRTPCPRRRSDQTSDPIAAMRAAIAALTGALARATPKETPAIARQLVAAAKELEQAVIRAEQRRRTAEREAAEERRQQEIAAMIPVLREEFPSEPWGDCDIAVVAETLHEDGLYAATMLTGELQRIEREQGLRAAAARAAQDAEYRRPSAAAQYRGSDVPLAAEAPPPPSPPQPPRPGGPRIRMP